MNTKSYVVTAHKSIPLSAFPAEAWHSLMEGIGAASDDDLLKLYERVAWFRRGVDVRAEAVANLPWAFRRMNSEDELDEGQLPPFAFEVDMDNLLNVIEAWLVLYGAAYLFRGVNAAGIVKELRLMHPATITPQYDTALGLTGFKRRVPGSGKEDTLAVSDVVYFWLPSRKAEIGPGVAPALAAALAGGLLRSADGFAEMYFENGIIAPTLVTVPAGTQDAEKQRLEAWAKRAMSGLKKAFNVIGIAAEVKVSSLGEQIPLGSLALPEMTDKKREDISTAFGVPQSLLSSNAANFATAQQDDLHFYDKTVLPESKRIEKVLNKQLFEPLGWHMEFKPERLEAYQRLEAEKADKLALMYERDIYTREEVREEMGKEATPAVGKFKSEMRTEAAITIARERPTPQFIPGQQQPPPQLPAGQNAEQKAITDELTAWERKAIRRLREGKPDKAAEFESDVLPVYTRAWVAGQLEEAATVDAVKAAFAGVSEWAEYP